MAEPSLTAIEAEFLDEEGWKKTSPLNRAAVRLWMDSSNLEILGAVHNLLFVKEHLSRVLPPLSWDEVVRFRKHYYGRCLREISIEEGSPRWADWGFNVAHYVVFWFYELWKDKAVPRPILFDLKDWMAGLLKEQVQEGILVSAIADHLLGHRKIAKLFTDWHDDPELRSIFRW